MWTKRCDKCNEIKPARTHHCSACGCCVFHMDHHCPWINNCVGMENLRYFLLFLLYLDVGMVYMFTSTVAIWHHPIYAENRGLMSFIVMLDATLVVVLGGFNFWNWFLAYEGLTTLEFFAQVSGQKKGAYDYSFETISDNLFKIFGTSSWAAALSPSLRSNPFTGLEWSFEMRELGFDEHGDLPEEEESPINEVEMGETGVADL